VPIYCLLAGRDRQIITSCSISARTDSSLAGQDIITRHANSNGFYVERRFGWDTHGLPVEHELDKKLGIKGKEDVMKIGIKSYNAQCRAGVMRYASEWEATVERMGRWIDFKNDYKTLNTTYMESVWWVFSQLFDKGLVYRGLRVMPYSTGCTTPLSNFEAGADFRDVNDPAGMDATYSLEPRRILSPLLAVTVSFPLVDDSDTLLLAWTTTPWTLPSNLALCVHPDFEYIKIFDEERKKHYVLHEALLGTIYKDPKKAKFRRVATFKGSEMKGWRYEPLFDYFTDKVCQAIYRRTFSSDSIASFWEVRRSWIPSSQRQICNKR
jgi:isoleucyl-tRNA synthetase